jgi:peptidoglycan/xylan/chitin deacetylase (PgdA/CDA1 family)
MNTGDVHKSALKLSLMIFLLFPIFTTNAQTAPKLTLPEKQIALTFDDGPYGTPTVEVLNILKRENIHATFFVIGQNVEKYNDITKEIVADGNVIANHTFNHPRNLAVMPLKEFDSELSKTEKAISSVTNLQPDLFRAPYGNTSSEMLKELAQDKYTLVSWDVDPSDWDYSKSTPDIIEKTIFTEAKPNAIILLHDGRDTHIDYPRDNLIKALPKVIETLQKEGYTFVTVDKLLGVSAYKSQ